MGTGFRRNVTAGALSLTLGCVGLIAAQEDVGAKIYAKASPSVLVLVVKSEAGEALKQGTGFFVEGGLIVTNEHVVRGGRVFVDLGSVSVPATVRNADILNDLAVLKLEGEVSAQPLPLAAHAPPPGTRVHAIGNPAGLSKSISSGVVSGIREFEGRSLIQVTAPMSPGSSGGPVLDDSGRVIGVAVAILREGQNLNFAVPASLVGRLLRGEARGSSDVAELIDRAAALSQKLSEQEYEADAESLWQTTHRAATRTLGEALERAGSDYAALLRIALTAKDIDSSVAAGAAERAISTKPSAEAHLRGLIRTCAQLKRYSECDQWFGRLVDSGQVSARDWSLRGQALSARGEYRQSGAAFLTAARGEDGWTNWCRAEKAYGLSDGDEDTALAAARKCIEEGAGKKSSDDWLGHAHFTIATTLNTRGVYEEALSHAREASALEPSDPFYLHEQARALSGLRRFQEAINAAKQAVRLSDGKYDSMHFALGAAYFDTENWEMSKQSFEMAARLDPKDSAAPYNIALCCLRLGYTLDAASWFEEVLRREPNHRERQQLLERIQRLRR